MTDTCFYYYRTNRYNVTIAYRRSIDSGAVLFGAAFCSSRDQFVKSRGRQIATGRLFAVPLHLELQDTGELIPRRTVHDMILSRLESECDYAPDTFRL